MKTLSEEANQFYSIKTDDLICAPALVRNAFIAGANSQYVNNQIIQAQIDILINLSKVFDMHKQTTAIISNIIEFQIQELQKQLEK